MSTTDKFSHWNFRLAETRDGGLGFIEAYYDKNNRLIAWGNASVYHVEKDHPCLMMAMNRPVLKFSDLPGAEEGNRTFVLYGFTDRDHKELVCQFFATKKDRRDFIKCLPGTYRKMRLVGIGYDDFSIKGIES